MIANNNLHLTFSQRVWKKTQELPTGNVTTYQDIAHALGTKAYRAVGQALNRNPHAPQVPCHRVVASDGSIGGYAHGVDAKIALLAKEGVDVSEGRVVDFARKRWIFQ